MHKVKNVRVNDSFFHKYGPGLGITLLVGTLVAGGLTNFGKESSSPKEQVAIEKEISSLDSVAVVDMDDINLVLDNSGLDDQLYQSVLSNLRQDDVKFREHQEGLPVTPDETVVSLTSNRYVNGRIALYGPKNHTGGNNDNLMAAFETACEYNDWNQERIHFGRFDNGELKETSLEAELGIDVPMITLQFSETEDDASKISTLIEDGITRYVEQKQVNPNTQYFHTIQLGETISEIAESYHVSDEWLQDLNNLTSPNQIRDGVVLQIRGRSGILDPTKAPSKPIYTSQGSK